MQSVVRRSLLALAGILLTVAVRLQHREPSLPTR